MAAKMGTQLTTKTLYITEWLGLNQAVGELLVKPNEAIECLNFRITKDKKPSKRDGYMIYDDQETEVTTGEAGWIGTIGGNVVLIYDSDGSVYQKVLATEVVTTIGTISATIKNIIYYHDAVLISTGLDIYEYDGTTFQSITVSAYNPKIYTDGEYDAQGYTLFEEINLLTDNADIVALGNGTDTVFTLPIDVDGVNSVDVTGVTATFTFTSPRTVTITSGVPADDAEVTFNVDHGLGNPDLIIKNPNMALFGTEGKQLFLYGADNKTIRISGISEGYTYFGALNYSEVRSSDYPITSMVSANDRLLAFKQNSTDYTYVQDNPLYTDNKGLNKYIYTFYNTNDAYGSESSAEIIGEGTPVTLDAGAIQQWNYGSVVNNIDPTPISDRIRNSLESEDLSTAVTFNYKRLKEYWVNIGDTVYIYNYGTDVFYMYDNIEANWFLEYEGEVYFGDKNGVVQKFDDTARNDNGVAIKARLVMGFYDGGRNDWYKSIFEEYITIAAGTRTSLTTTYQTDEDNEEYVDEDFIIDYVRLDFNDLDFNDLSFLTNGNPQSENLDTKIKNFIYISHIFKNEKLNETCTILSWRVPFTFTYEL